jgi:hypothetical protein
MNSDPSREKVETAEEVHLGRARERQRLTLDLSVEN